MPSSAAPEPGQRRLRLSVVVEWANTEWNGVPRAFELFRVLADQWQDLVEGRRPPGLSAAALAELDRFDPRAELLIVSSVALSPLAERRIHERDDLFDARVIVGEGLEYYPLKNRGAAEASGDLLLFVDSDVRPDADWLPVLLASLADPAIDVVCGRTYVAPTDLVARAFALGWTYPLPNRGAELRPVHKFYANTILFRAEIFRRTGFRDLGHRTRGAASLLREDLARLGISVWENPRAGVAHPPPADWRHLAVRALAHGRDQYMTRSENRHWSGLRRSLGISAFRAGRAFFETARSWRRVGLKPWEIPAALAICSAYYGFFALGGVLTHVSPQAMGRRFRV